MTIHKASANSYSTVTAESTADYIKTYAERINDYVNGLCGEGDKLASKNKSQLNAIAAELETVQKRLDYILYGRY